MQDPTMNLRVVSRVLVFKCIFEQKWQKKVPVGRWKASRFSEKVAKLTSLVSVTSRVQHSNAAFCLKQHDPPHSDWLALSLASATSQPQSTNIDAREFGSNGSTVMLLARVPSLQVDTAPLCILDWKYCSDENIILGSRSKYLCFRQIQFNTVPTSFHKMKVREHRSPVHDDGSPR